MMTINYGAFAGLMRNGQRISNAENFLNECISNGMYIAIQNPDGTTVRLQKGFKIYNCEAVITTSNGCERINFNTIK